MSKRSKFGELIESSLTQLTQMVFHPAEEKDLYLYWQVLRNYLQGDLQSLSTWSEIICADPSLPICLVTATRLRVSIRQKDLQPDTLISIENHFSGDEMWEGEIYFLLGYSWDELKEYTQAIRCFGLAEKALMKSGCGKKSLKALHNKISAFGCLEPNRRLLTDFFTLYKRAKVIQDRGMCGLALMNLSREYERLGALALAYRQCQQAVSYLRDEFGGLQFYLAVAQRAHLLLKLGRVKEALQDFELASTAAFPEVISALNVLSEELQVGDKSLRSGDLHLNPAWSEIKKEVENKTGPIALSTHESLLIKALTAGPSTKFELIEKLYGDKIDSSSGLGRFKHLIIRFKKKYPGFLIQANGRYSLSAAVEFKS